MTDGIIQQEVNKLLGYGYDDILLVLQLELIEKIKQEFDNYKCYLGCTNEEHLLRKKDVLKSLIGDNQE